jgi:hypothetical protein
MCGVEPEESAAHGSGSNSPAVHRSRRKLCADDRGNSGDWGHTRVRKRVDAKDAGIGTEADHRGYLTVCHGPGKAGSM